MHFFAVMLWVAAVLAWLAATPELAAAVVAVVVVNGLFSFWQEYPAERAADALEKLLPEQAIVRRDGREFVVSAAEIVPGDLLILRPGEAVAADARLICCQDLKVDLSHSSGESRPVARTAEAIGSEALPWLAAPNLLFAGSYVMSGTGEAVVFATDGATRFGQLARLAQQQPQRPSPLEGELQHVVRVVATVAVSLGVACFWAAEA
ncbi:MAG: hypothetical protein N3C12_10140 [Candidatus Binatia bacterium]|nr:hypothetical protein [Candidatus Binatia bacterium]